VVADFRLALTFSVLPETILVVLAGVTALIALLRPGERPTLHRWIACIALAGAVAASGIELFGMRLNKSGVGLVAASGNLVADRLGVYVTVAACVVAFIVCLLSDTYIRRVRLRSGGFFALLLMSTAALSALAGERDMITFFVALQTLVVCLGLIVALVKTDDVAAESAFKVSIEGAVAGAVLLYGLAVLYGASGSGDLGRAGAASHRAPLLVAVGVALVLLALTFTAGLIPFRRWVRRTAEHVPAVPAGFVLALGLSGGGVAWLRAGVSGFGAAVPLWTVLTAILVAVTAGFTGLAALRAANVRRLVAALASLQSATLLLGVISFSGFAGKVAPQGPVAVLLALALFAIGLIAVFAVLSVLEAAGVGMSYADLRGVGYRSPATALLLGVSLVSLVGVPPLAGFFARLLLFESAIDSGFGWLVIVVLASTALGVVGVVRLLTAMYAETGDERPFTMAATPRLPRTVAIACCAATFLLGVITQPLLTLAGGGARPLL
jgi:NADH-quinone oxidoreductase subunit N